MVSDPLAPIRALVAEVTALRAEVRALRTEVVALRAANARLRRENARLRRENARLRADLAARDARIAELERQLGAGGPGGGSRPAPRPRSPRSRGGQPGHPGRGRTMPTVIDATIDHPLDACPHCGGPVTVYNPPDDRIEREAVERALRTLRHRLGKGWCARCRKLVRAPTPDLLPRTAYGPHAHATLAALRAGMGATIGDLETFTASVWHAPVGGGQLVAMLERVTIALLPAFDLLVGRLATEPVLFNDTTTWWVDGHRAVLWVFTNRRLTVYWIDPTKSGWVPRVVAGAAVAGVVVTDGAAPWQRVAHPAEQRCLAHPLREARDLLAARGDAPEVARMMPALMHHLAWLIALGDRRGDLAAATIVSYRWRARRVLLDLAAKPWTDPDCARLAKRILREVDAWVLFLDDPTGEVEPTDSRSERALRGPVIDRKRMQQSRGLRGVFREMVLRSLWQTCHQLGVSFEDVVVEALLTHGRDGTAARPPPTLVAALEKATATRPHATKKARERPRLACGT